jgi:anti-anti-sigma factor
MPAKRLEASVRFRRGGAVVDLHGEINGFAEDALDAAYTEAASENPEVILFNFADVTYINSTGIALIVGILAQARAAKQRVLACGLSDHYVEIFSITRLSDFMDLFPDEERAMADVAQR